MKWLIKGPLLSSGFSLYARVLTDVSCFFLFFLLSSFHFQEEQNRGKPNWEHLNEDLHVLLTVEDTQSRAEIKMRRAVDEVKKLLVPAVSTPAFVLQSKA